MPIKHRWPLCGKSNPDWCTTPGSTGINDSADPNHTIMIRRSRSSQGVIRMAEEGELVLAQAGPGSRLPAQKGKTNEISVILTSQEKGWYQWAKQFVAYSSKSRSLVKFEKKLNRKKILKAYSDAAQRIGSKGLLIVSAGHGYSKGFKSGAVDLAPGGQLFLSSDHFRIKADPRLVLQKKDQELMKTFEDIGNTLRKFKVKKVLFLSCNVGTSHDFLQEIADEWQVEVWGYIWILVVRSVKIRARKSYVKWAVYFESKPPRKQEIKLDCTRNYPNYPTGRVNIWKIRPQKKKDGRSAKPR